MRFLSSFSKHNNQIKLADLGYKTRPAYSKSMYSYMRDKNKYGSIDLVSEKISYIFDKDKRGGVITLSTDVNAVYKETDAVFDKIKNWLESRIKTISNRISRKKKVTKFLKDVPEVTGFTVGNYLTGRYIDEQGRVWNEKSFSVEILGIEKETLDIIAAELADIFDQETVLVRSYETGDVYFVEEDDELKVENQSKIRKFKIDKLIN